MKYDFEELPQEVQDLIFASMNEDNEGTYDGCQEVVDALATIGWTCNFDLGAELFDFQKLPKSPLVDTTIDVMYGAKNREENDTQYYIYFTRKGKWCYLITVQSLEVARCIVAKEKHTDSVHGLKPALYAVLEGDEVLQVEDDMHNSPIDKNLWSNE